MPTVGYEVRASSWWLIWVLIIFFMMVVRWGVSAVMQGIELDDFDQALVWAGECYWRKGLLEAVLTATSGP